ncbi:hypothetical protein YYE_04961 [Plasmodium vinckei vinckei]|uniref:PIR protein CIR protein n=1 Tax=Plasmodium vinckei vinckei TaxID=54757 RepID=A0A081I934_PLAVN|nr:hypothetical protein YYE_04961 [Plasmodium vinckei vinckei]
MKSIFKLKRQFHYSGHQKLCKLLLEGDSYFKDENVDTTKINKEKSIKSYCSNDDCKTNEERINALTVYIYMKFKNSIKKLEYNDYDECLLMWLSDKLFKIYYESKGDHKKKGFVYRITLNQAYNTYLKKHKVKLSYWVLFDNIKGLKEANLKYMSELYILLNKICNTIVDYKDKGAESKKLHKNYIDCRRQYRTLHNNISECQSYLDLLNKLKGIYDDFRSYAIKKNGSKNDLKTKLQTLTTEDGVEMDAVRSFKTYDFSDSKCKFSKKKTASSKKTDKSSLQPSNQLKDSQHETPPTDKSEIKAPKLQSSPEPASSLPTTPQVQKQDSPSPPPEPQPPAADSPPPQSTQDGGSSKTPQTGGSSSGNGNPGDGSSDPASSTPGGSFDLGSSILKFILNGTDKLNKTSQFIQQNQKMFKDAKDKISSAYNDTVENLKNVYNVSSSHFNNIINNITSHLNQVGTPPKSSGKQSGPGCPIDGGNKLNQSPSNSQQNPPSPPPQQPPPPTPPQLPSPPIPTPITLPDPLKGSPQQKQPSSQSQTITQHPPQVPVKVNQPNHKTVVQFVKSLSSDLILKKPWNIFPTTWNGSGDCKPEVNFMNTTLVCCTSEQCSLTGITVTLVLIPIILLIAYKYLSFGSSKKSEKKNMKKVINFHDGKRKTKIIISSNDRSKDLKPVINSIGGKKDSLLNIYKIIQADPMPFINLFFLLIFFVYKRKRDTIE